jgi:L-serine dehydratase
MAFRKKIMVNSGDRISVFEIFKIGIGPSSSHTMGPWKAASEYILYLLKKEVLQDIRTLTVNLYGSLAKTGKGHGTDMAIMLGLMGEKAETVIVNEIDGLVRRVRNEKRIILFNQYELTFDPAKDIVFNKDIFLTFHPNGIFFEAVTDTGESYPATYYSIGGGFIVKGEYPIRGRKKTGFPYPIDTSADVLKWTKMTHLSFSEIVYQNELSLQPAEKVDKKIKKIWDVMKTSIYRGCHTEGFLPGGLKVKRRAFDINRRLLPDDQSGQPEEWIKQIKSGNYAFNDILKWVSCFALAVNEENASFGRVVTAPTNGAAGVIPAVLLYMVCFMDGITFDEIKKFILAAGEIGSIFKKGSTISAAMGGCQAEIGVSSAMAAAALTECLGGGPEKALMAAEIAMEHHLGLTCDPVGGLVQIPCIERNSMGAIKAITASMLALESDPHTAKVSLDHVIKTMWETALDMNSKYKETSDGGLAINIPVNIPDC